ncbi:SulP family sulfate permease [Agromyces flavus]|uniref:High affinity sulphate transporter 1 n=1 Tax=Agromyces flavus TaxID=589382 RepID=A0A1H1WSH1_9MICO|nr:sulfate permease [Agromyces flavus]MCP2366228.1 SulP family sulfate permease [Agromyces flavus]GGI44254.1 sodium-independent anion transporter [Agromyces flavus]SDS99306.1 high affinity sulphate transporter 1 [Agromyces flavus]
MSRRRVLTGLLPILDWARSYDRRWLRGDLIAGVTVAALIVPKNLGYAGIAGIPLQNGLYAAAAGAILYGIFGTSRQISMGPSSALAAVAASAVLVSGLTDQADVASFVAGITLASGVLFLILFLLRMGWIAQFLSRAVVTGFLFGAAIDVVISELPKLTGTEASGANSFQELWSWFGSLDDTHGATLIVGVVSLVVVFGVRVVAPRVPGALVLVVGGLIASWLLALGDRGVALVGEVPRGLPAFAVPDLGLMWENASTVAIAAVALVLIGFSQTAGDARTFAAKHRYQVDIDQESVAQGMANVGAGLFQGMPVSTSLSASSLNDHSGARTGLASLTSGATVLLTLLVLAPLFSLLPKPVLAALIIEAVVMGMINIPEMRRLARVQPFDFWIAVAAIVATLAFGVLAGVMIGIGLSLLWLIGVATHPSIPTLAREAGTDVFRDVSEFPEDRLTPGVVVIRMDGGLFFATADALEDRIREIIHSTPELTGVVLDCAGINFIDSQGSAKMNDVVTLAEDSGITLRLARLKKAVRATLQRDGVLPRVGTGNIHGNVARAVQAQLDASPPASGGSRSGED